MRVSAMSPEIYLPIAKHSINIFVLLGMGGGVGLISGMFGVGGGFLMTPLLIMIGIPPLVAAASDSNQIIGAATSGTFAHYRMGHVDAKMGLCLVLGTLAGSTLGVKIIETLRILGKADFLIRITYVVILGIIGFYMLLESARSLRTPAPAGRSLEQNAAEPFYARLGRRLPGKIHFAKSGITVSPLMPFLVGCFVGTLASIMGIGGGFIMVPLMFYFLRIPMHLVVGTNLFQELFLCLNVTVMQAVDNHAVDLVLALVLLLGSTVGAQIGARLSRRMHAEQLRFLLAVIVLLVMFKILLGLTLKPELILDMKGGG